VTRDHGEAVRLMKDVAGFRPGIPPGETTSLKWEKPVALQSIPWFYQPINNE